MNSPTRSGKCDVATAATGLCQRPLSMSSEPVCATADSPTANNFADEELKSLDFGPLSSF
eukprot:12214972-Heterocapsa_arctica.AAC.1